jgi:hypothetical protein
MFPPSIQRAFDILHVLLIFLKYQQFIVDKLLHMFIGDCYHFKDLKIAIFIIFVSKRIFNFQPLIMDVNDSKIFQHKIHGFSIVIINYGHTLGER